VSDFKFGLIHAPLTPFAPNAHGQTGAVDHATYAKVLDFHIAHGAEGLAIPTHAGESVSLTADERKALLAFAIKHVAGRVPVVANVSEAGTEIAADLAAHARAAGAAAIIASVPYYWTPPQSMLVEHFATIAEKGGLPLFVWNAPEEMNNVEVKAQTMVELLQRSPNTVGLIDVSLDWQYMIEVASSCGAARKGFQFISGSEYMISAGATGATGMLTPLSSVAPKLVRELYDLCRAEKYAEARPVQEDAALLFRALKESGAIGLKAAAKYLGRDCGIPRPPLPPMGAEATQDLIATLSTSGRANSEPRGWA
jgi:4-hydroxy-tetrahydrodipicolinate synthase